MVRFSSADEGPMDLTAISLSALRTAGLGSAVRANYQAKRLEQEDQAQGGVRPAGLFASPDPTVPNGSNVDLAVEFTEGLVDTATYQAGLRVLRTADELLGQTLDLKA
jgi:flagellar basal body rod protein FlgG